MNTLNKTLQMVTLVGSLSMLTGCLIPVDQNGNYDSSGAQKQHNHNNSSNQSGASEWHRGCGDAKAGAYDRSGHASQAYEEGWNACKTNTNNNNRSSNVGTEWDRGCYDAKHGGYDRSGNAGQAYEDGWNACK